MSMASIHDSGYKILFSNRTIFRQFMESFVEQPWVKQLDFDRAERIDKSFIDEEYQERESDLIYRIPWGNEEIYVYVLLEFQSTVDRLMALRVMNYVVNLYMDLTRNRTNLQKLPPIFPIVLYNGEGRWTAATDMADLIEPVPGMGEYALHFRLVPADDPAQPYPPRGLRPVARGVSFKQGGQYSVYNHGGETTTGMAQRGA